jgi:hypothetical protein
LFFAGEIGTDVFTHFRDDTRRRRLCVRQVQEMRTCPRIVHGPRATDAVHLVFPNPPLESPVLAGIAPVARIGRPDAREPFSRTRAGAQSAV